MPVRKGIITDKMINEKMAGYFSQKQAFPTFSREVTDISKPDKEITNGVKHLLLDILKHPLSGVVKRYLRLGINRRQGNAYKQHLIEKGFIQTKEIPLKEGRITLFEITAKGKSFLNQEGFDTVEYNEGIEHRFWKWKISQYYKKSGYDVEVEKRVNGQPDILITNKNETIAVEIETGLSDALSNIEKGIKSGFSMVISIATNEGAERAIKEQLKRQNLDKDKRIRLVSARGFDYD